MWRLAAGRLASAVPLILLITIGTFALGQLMPGDQAYAVAGPDATAEQVAQVRRDLNLDDPRAGSLRHLARRRGPAATSACPP